MSLEYKFLLEEAQNSVPRALGFCDRSPKASTYGCCDRTYWHYRQADFANARFQEVGLLLSYAYIDTRRDNRFSRNPKLLEWIVAIWSYWLSSQNRDGSRDEAYPNERSFCATAFSAAAFVQSIILLREEYDWTLMLPRAKKTMKWLALNRNDEVLNQMAGSYVALSGYAFLVDDESTREWRDYRKAKLIQLADEDGIFPEYGGFDSGYQSLTMSTLAAGQVLIGEDIQIRDLLSRAAATMQERNCGEVGFSPELNSRRTQYLYPFGLAFGGDASFGLEIVSQVMSAGMLRPSWMDDRYCISLATDYYRAAIHSDRQISA